jgi:hypothetical protein
MARKAKRKRRVAGSKPALRPDISGGKLAAPERFSTRFIDATLIAGAALGLLVTYLTGSIAPDALSHRGRLSLP